MQPPAAAKRATSNLPHNRFGLVEQIREDVPQGDEQAPVEPMADIIRRRRSTSLTFFKGILGF